MKYAHVEQRLVLVWLTQPEETKIIFDRLAEHFKTDYI